MMCRPKSVKTLHRNQSLTHISVLLYKLLFNRDLDTDPNKNQDDIESDRMQMFVLTLLKTEA